MRQLREYIGDGVYASVDEAGQIWLDTERHIDDTELNCFTGVVIHEIALEPDMMDTLSKYASKINELRRQSSEGN